MGFTGGGGTICWLAGQPSTTHRTALEQILAVWTSSDSYNLRANKIRNGNRRPS